MRVLGIDPGTRCLGWALYDTARGELLDAGVYDLPDVGDADERVRHVPGVLRELIPHGCNLDLVAVEKQFSRDNCADRPLHVVAWMVKTRAREVGLPPPVEIPAASARKAVVGRGNATKPEVLACLRERLGYDFPSTDASDAACVAVAAVAYAEVVVS